MKHFYLLLLVISAITTNAQIINFPDANLKTKLLSLGIDTNFNNEIEISEAAVVDSLDIRNSNISSLSGLENFPALTYLHCGINNISDLSPLQNSSNLTNLICSLNNITTLVPIMSLPLQNITCAHNQLTSVDITPLSGTLESFACHFNQISTLNYDTENNVLNYLNVAHNQLTTFSYEGTGLLYLETTFNPITNISLSGHIGQVEITTLQTSLDLSGLTFTELDVRGNYLTYLNIKNGNQGIVIYTSIDAPNLEFLCVNENASGSWYLNPNTVINSYCSFSPGGTYYTISGENRLDGNGDGCDASDLSVPFLQYQISDGNLSGSIISDGTGSYSLPVSTGVHSIFPALEHPEYFNISPSSVTVTFPDESSPFSQDFCLTPNGNFADTEILIVPTVPARPGFDAHYDIVYKNKGNTIASGSIAFNFDDTVLDFVSASAAPSVVNGGDLTWQFTDLMPFETRVISLTLNVNSPMETPAVNIDDLLTFEAMINSLSEDVTPADNAMTFEQTVIGAYDPNDITCIEGDFVGPEMAGQYVHYLIRFENTGNYHATNVVVKNMIDLGKFDLNTLVPLHSSHNFITRITGNKVEFIFENIMLPFDDANNDGYIAFKIKIKPSLVIGDTFTQQADIFFDFNHPIVTNVASTTISALATSEHNFSNNLTLYPNPAIDMLNIKSAHIINSYAVYNIVGQQLFENNHPTENPVIDISGLVRGSYFIKVSSEVGTETAKFHKK